MQSITAYRLVASDTVSLSAAFETGDIVRIDNDAVPESHRDAGVDADNMDDEYDYSRVGVVMEVHEEDFGWVGEGGDTSITVELDDDETAYVVGLSLATAGSYVFRESELERLDRDNVLGDTDGSASDAADTMSEMAHTAESDLSAGDELVGLDTIPTRPSRTQAGLSPWPESWRESDKPARLIALDAWTSMGGTFRGCRRELAGNTRNPNRVCAAFKDQLYGHPYWREGG